jgi:hypothetical protein
VQFLNWLRALAFCYVAILLVYVVGRGFMSAAFLSGTPAQAPANPAPAKSAPAYPASPSDTRSPKTDGRPASAGSGFGTIF